jgi:SWI/SNF-related matrix-associated actin-dependent regulator 1 of chromatin subfamily A
MQITKIGNRYIACSTYNEREIPKAAGFRWDPEAREWWTPDPSRAAKLVQYADDSCRDELLATREESAKREQASRATDVDIDIPRPAGLEYFPFQRAGIAYALRVPNVLIADEMGLGKTIQAIGVVNADDAIRRVLVVCPASLKLNWQRELEKWLTKPLRVGIADSRTLPVADVVIVNYDVLHKHDLQAEMFDLLVVDEAHRIKNGKARRTQQVLALRARRRVYMTGTPLVNRPVELWTLIHSLDPTTWSSFWPYAKRYCGAARNKYGWDLSGASNLHELQARLRGTIMVRRLKRDVLTELPPKIRQVIELPADGATAEIAAERAAWQRHEAAIDELRAAVELAKASEAPDDYRNAVERLQAGARVAFTEISRLRYATALAKAPQVIEHVREALEEDGRKVVIFAHHHDVIDHLMAAFGSEAVALTGDTPLADRQAAVDRFQADDQVRVFIGSLTAAGVGITLTASSHVVFAELDWVPGNVTQGEDRCHRIGQRSSVLAQHLVLEGSLDATMARALVAKQDTIDKALDDPIEAQVPVAPAAGHVSVSRKALDAEASRMTPEVVEAVHKALRILAAFDPDHAMELNAVGFNRVDGLIGHSLAGVAALTPRQSALGRRLVLKYHRQLPVELNNILRQLSVTAPT